MKPAATTRQILETAPAARPRSKTADLDAFAKITDSAFRIPFLNVRFGIDSIIGLIPGLGDIVTALMSLYVLAAGQRYGVPRVTMLRMGLNVAIDALFGAIPFFGDLFDVFWKANQRNVALIRRHVNAPLHERGRARRSDWLFLAVVAAIVIALLAGAMYLAYSLVAWLVAAIAG